MPSLIDLRRLLPGLLIAGTISLAASFLSEHYGGPVMLFALLLGIAFNFVSEDARCAPGIEFASRTILRWGVALLGVRITAEQVLGLGATPIAVAVAGVTVTILVALILARRLGLTRDLGILTGGAVAICGASAALALSAILAKGKGITERDTIVTVVAVTTLSTVAMVVYPLVAVQLDLDAISAGIFLGATIHDVAQVVGAGYSLSPEAGDAATVTKLLRVAMLVPVVLAVVALLRFGRIAEAAAQPILPLFLLAFVALALANSFGLIPSDVSAALSSVSRWALIAAIAALGTKTSLKELATVGPRTLVLIVTETLVIAGLGLGIVMAMR